MKVLGIVLSIITLLLLSNVSGAFTFQINSYHNYQSHFWGYDATYAGGGTSSSTWSSGVYTSQGGTIANGEYQCSSTFNNYLTWNWGDGTTTQFLVDTQLTPLSGFSGTYTINGVLHSTSYAGELCNQPYTAQAGANGYTNTAFGSQDGNGYIAFQMDHIYSSAGVYPVSVTTSGGNSNTISIAIISLPTTTAPIITHQAFDKGAVSSISDTITFSCGTQGASAPNSPICANDYFQLGTLTTTYNNLASPSTITKTLSSTSLTGIYTTVGSIYNPITGNSPEGLLNRIYLYSALQNPTLTITQSGTTTTTIYDTLQMQLKISVPIQTAGTNSELAPQMIINWGDGNVLTIPTNSADWTTSNGNYITTQTHTYSSSYTGSPAVSVVLNSWNAINYGTNYGSSSSTSQSINVYSYQNPTLTITPPTTNICSANGIYTGFSGNYEFSLTTGSYPLTQLTIQWGDGSSNSVINNPISAQTTSHIYYSSGTYTLTATATDSNGRTGQASRVISINSYITPSVSVSSTTAIATIGKTFTSQLSQGTCPLNSVVWLWGDGNSNTATAYGGQNTYAHTYAISQGISATSYSLQVIATDTQGKQATGTGTISVSYTYPQIGSVSPITIYGTPAGSSYINNFSLYLTAGTNPLSQLVWAWGDGTTATTNNGYIGINTAEHSYPNPASSTTQSLTLTASDTNNHYSSSTQTINVNPYPNPILSSITLPTIAYKGVSQNYSLTITQATGGFNLYNIIWNWGDGITDTYQGGTASQPIYGNNIMSHTYQTAGNYTISVQVIDVNQVSTTNLVSVAVNNYSPPKLTNFTISYQINTNPADTIITGLNSQYKIYLQQGNYSITKLVWNWGNSNTTTINNPAGNQFYTEPYIYTQAGTYTLTITATDTQGFNGVFTEILQVDPYVLPLITTFTPNQTILDKSTDYTLSVVEGTEPLSNYSVDFGIGSNKTGTMSSSGGTRTITYTYTASGYYDAVVSIDDILGNSTNKIFNIYSQQLPQITAFYNESYNNQLYTNINTSFIIGIDSGSNALKNLTLYYGDGNSRYINLNNSTSQSLKLNHTYLSGTYIVYFNVSDSNNNIKTSKSLIVTINNYKYASILNVSPTTVYDVETNIFNISMQKGSFQIQNVSLKWGDGTPDTLITTNQTEVNTTHIYPFNSVSKDYTLLSEVCDINGYCTAKGTIITTSYMVPSIINITPIQSYATVPTDYTFDIAQGTFVLADISVNWGDNTAPSILQINSTSPILNHTYQQAGTYTLTATAYDINSENSLAFIKTITINPYVYPEVSELSPSSITAGLNTIFNLTAVEGTFKLRNITINWGNGQVYPYNITNGNNIFNYTYSANGNFTAVETITDIRNISTRNSTIINVLPAPYTFTTPNKVISYTIATNSSPIIAKQLNVNYSGNATLPTTFTTQKDNIINNYICNAYTSITALFTIQCNLNPQTLSTSPQTLYVTIYSDNSAGDIHSVTETINIHTTLPLPTISTPFNTNQTIATPITVTPYVPIQAIVIIGIASIGVIAVILFLRRRDNYE